MNDSEREDWVNNDEGLYNKWKRSGLSMSKFVRKNRQLIDAIAGEITSGKKPAHSTVIPSWIKKSQN